MPQVQVTIAGRPYRMACADGEEEHLKGLAQRLDARIADLRRDFGEIGDQRITVMAAIMMADEVSEAERRIAALEAAVASLRQSQQDAEVAARALGDVVADTLDELAARVDRVAHALDGAPRA